MCFFSQYRPCTSAGLCFPVSSPGRSPHRDVIKINDIMSHRGPRPFRKQVLLWSGGSAAPPWVCCSSSPQGLTLEVTFMVFPVTLAVYGLPALSPAVTMLSGQLLSGLLVVPGLEGFAKISHQCFTVHVKTRELSWRGDHCCFWGRLSVLGANKGGKAGVEVPDCSPQRSLGQEFHS